MPFLRRAVCSLLVLATIVAPIRATWSILLVDTRTGEIAVGSATCLTNFDLRRVTPVILVNRGAATAQAAVPGSITNRRLIWTGLMGGLPPSQILAELAAIDPGHQSRQYGIVDVGGATATFSGSRNSQWAGGVTGRVGTIFYAIQGNILTGQPVVTAAEKAVVGTPGDLAEKLMAAMEAARALGGDGRCSCSPVRPTSCGAPPPQFEKSAHIGFMIVARQGDIDGTCTSTGIGCASGTYYLNLNVAFQSSSRPDPVIQLRGLFNTWRASWVGRPDHNLSTVSPNPPTLVPDGSSSATVTVALRDWQGTPLTSGGATVTVVAAPSSTAPVAIGPVIDNGDGTYTFAVTAGTTVGAAHLHITVDDGQGPVLLSPRTTVPVSADPLWADTATQPAAAGGAVGFRLDAGAGAAQRAYFLAMSGTGTSPGVLIPPSTTLPLNVDPFFLASLARPNSSVFVNTLAALDALGRGRAQFVTSAGVLAPIVGLDLDFAYVLLNPIDFASNPVRVRIVP